MNAYNYQEVRANVREPRALNGPGGLLPIPVHQEIGGGAGGGGGGGGGGGIIDGDKNIALEMLRITAEQAADAPRRGLNAWGTDKLLQLRAVDAMNAGATRAEINASVLAGGGQVALKSLERGETGVQMAEQIIAEQRRRSADGVPYTNDQLTKLIRDYGGEGALNSWGRGVLVESRQIAAGAQIAEQIITEQRRRTAEGIPYTNVQITKLIRDYGGEGALNSWGRGVIEMSRQIAANAGGAAGGGGQAGGRRRRVSKTAKKAKTSKTARKRSKRRKSFTRKH